MTVLDIVRANFSRRSDIQGELRQIDEAATADTRAYTEAEDARITELRSELEAIDGRISANLEIEARSQTIESGITSLLGTALSRDGEELRDNRSLGQRFVDRDELRSWVASGGYGTSPVLSAGDEFRAIVDLTTAGAQVNPERLARIGTDFLDRRTFLLDLLPSIPVSTGNVEYVQDQSPLVDLADVAAETAEGGAKPKAGITLALVNEPTATIPAWANITRQTVQDAPQMQGYLDGRLRYAVKRRADAQSINGNGTAPNLRGLRNRSGIVTYAPGSAEARYRSIRRAIRLGEDAEAVYEIIVLNPSDAEIFDLSNDTANGLHAADFNGLVAPSPRTSWGLTQVRSTAIPAGTALLIDPMAVAVLDRMDVTAFVTDSHASNFTSNILTLMLEARIGLALFDPAGVARITFNGTT